MFAMQMDESIAGSQSETDVNISELGTTYGKQTPGNTPGEPIENEDEKNCVIF
jgi:hypothetical protein